MTSLRHRYLFSGHRSQPLLRLALGICLENSKCGVYFFQRTILTNLRVTYANARNMPTSRRSSIHSVLRNGSRTLSPTTTNDVNIEAQSGANACAVRHEMRPPRRWRLGDTTPAENYDGVRTRRHLPSSSRRRHRRPRRSPSGRCGLLRERLRRRTNGRTDGRTNGWSDGRTNGRVDERMDADCRTGQTLIKL